ncbi:MAG TPA: alpha/beta hydrolase [Candidatus Dormibacteraeota bacterium]
MKVGDAELAYTVVGSGEPVLCIHGVNIADAILGPLSRCPNLLHEYQFISYHRAGYHESTLAKPELSVEEGAAHARELLDHLGIQKAHVLAYSFGGIVGFQFLLSYPEYAHTAVLLEAYLPREESGAIQANIDAYVTANELYTRARAPAEKLAASQSYQTAICGASFLSCVDVTCSLDVWDKVTEATDTVFTVDLPAAATWKFKPSRADDFVSGKGKPTMPVLAVLGMDSEAACPGFRETQRFLMSWLPQAERHGVPNATHGLQMMNPLDVGEACRAFFQKYPMSGGASMTRP